MTQADWPEVTYLSDRQISIRMGQAFWCRGPALSARFTAQDFPSLQPHHPHSEDFASFLQAQVELTTLFGNAHDILFASRSRTAELMLRGDYVKYIDDVSKAMAAWQRAWRSIGVPPYLRSCMTLMQEYLRLYVNAFAFQAVLYRAGPRQSNTDSIDAPKPKPYFPDSTMATGDARHIYEAVDAAEKLLRIVTEDIDPTRHLRYMPARFYLCVAPELIMIMILVPCPASTDQSRYEIHSSVFLFKAHAAGAISSGKHFETSALMQRFISVLRTAAVDDNHIASRYAELLNRLWFHRPDVTMSRNLNPDSTNTEPSHTGLVDPLSMLSSDATCGQMLFDDIGLQPFDCTDTMDTLFAMPPAVFPWD